MSRVWRERILILAKTYPSPSARHVETSCVAGINERGKVRRLYPVPFRMIEDSQKFKKWQWIEANIEKAPADHRPESHKIDIGTLRLHESLPAAHNWLARRPWMAKIPSFNSIAELQEDQKRNGTSLAVLRPAQVHGLEITPASPSNWTQEEREKLMRAQMQGDLFATEAEAHKEVHELRKLPFNFHYRYSCNTADGPREQRHKIIDWEAGALYWRMSQLHGSTGWQSKFRAKFEADLLSRDLTFFMGNMHRFSDKWMIVSVFYPPKPKPENQSQDALF